MKKLCVFMATVAATICISCEKEPAVEPVKVLTASIAEAQDGELTIPAEGGRYTVTVKAENVEWKAAVSENKTFSLEGDVEGTADAGLTLVVAENTATEAVSGVLTVSAEGVEPITITLNQAKAELKLTPDKSALARMNLHGKVKGVSFYDNYIRDSYINNVTFDEAGNVTGFKRTDYYDGELFYTVEYDAEGRLSKIVCGDNSVAFGYGNHGQYVATNSLFEAVSYSLVLEFTTWIPMFIKDLSSITVVSTGYYAGTSVYEIAVDGATAAITLDSEEYGTMTFENGFTKESDCGSSYNAKKEVYTINYTTGNVLEILITDYYGDMIYKFNDDAVNSMSAVESEYMPATATYNDNLDVVSCGGLTFTYEYDDNGNWVKRTDSKETVEERTIEYF